MYSIHCLEPLKLIYALQASCAPHVHTYSYRASDDFRVKMMAEMAENEPVHSVLP